MKQPTSTRVRGRRQCLSQPLSWSCRGWSTFWLDGNQILFIEEDVNLWILGPGWRDGGHAPVWEVRQLTQLAQILWISQDQPLLRIMSRVFILTNVINAISSWTTGLCIYWKKFDKIWFHKIVFVKMVYENLKQNKACLIWGSKQIHLHTIKLFDHW